MGEEQIEEMAKRLGELLAQHDYSLVTAESCTGGGLSEIITRIAGSSGWFDRAYVTYSNAAKVEMIGVSEETLNSFGAVSENTAIEMAEGALNNSHADLSVSITGIAGPGGGSPEKPVGMVCFAWSNRQGETRSTEIIFQGDRQTIRQQACLLAMQGLLEYLE